MARPIKYNIDTAEVEKLASFGCTTREIADFFRCPESTMAKGYSDFITKGKNGLKKRLRMAQIKAAFDGNVVMQIWLGKQYLNQSDKISDADGNPLKLIIEVVKQTKVNE